ncbi:MAG: T9SS type A sorting domain-containing protein [Bacteroidales bacterium]
MKRIILLSVILFAPSLLMGQIIHVPADYPTIQQAINAAENGDTVLVADGIYFEQINFKGKKPLTVASEYLIEGDSNHIINTILDGSSITNPDSGSVVYFISGEDSTAVLAGFTITNGRGTITSTWNDIEGGAIWVSGSGAMIRNNRITHNSCEDYHPSMTMGVGGGGIGIDAGHSQNWVVIRNNLIDSNTVITNRPDCYCDGAGVLCGGNTVVSGNTFHHNVSKRTVLSQNYYSSSGGLYCYGDPSWGNQAVISGNIFRENRVLGNLAWGGGVICDGVFMTFTHNTVMNNCVGTLTAITNIGGGGMAVQNCLPGSVISNNIFRSNYSQSWSGGLSVGGSLGYDFLLVIENNLFLENQAGARGGGIGVTNFKVKMTNNVLAFNHALYAGAGYFHINAKIPDVHNAWLINNTIANNKAMVNFGAFEFSESNPLIFNCIFWNNISGLVNEIQATSGFAEVAYSNLDTNEVAGTIYLGQGILNTNPLFEDTLNLRPGHFSPCLDAGTDFFLCMHNVNYEAPGADIAGTMRPLDFQVDMGAWEIENWAVGLWEETGSKNPEAVKCYPNPFMGSTIIEYELSEPAFVTMEIFDPLGALMFSSVREFQNKGVHRTPFNAGTIPGGIYYGHLVAGNMRTSFKITVLQ